MSAINLHYLSVSTPKVKKCPQHYAAGIASRSTINIMIVFSFAISMIMDNQPHLLAVVNRVMMPDLLCVILSGSLVMSVIISYVMRADHDQDSCYKLNHFSTLLTSA